MYKLVNDDQFELSFHGVKTRFTRTEVDGDVAQLHDLVNKQDMNYRTWQRDYWAELHAVGGTATG